LSVTGIGAFPNSRSPRVLWLGLEAPKELPGLAEKVDAALGPLGFEREKRAFTPHVTLARFKQSRRRPDVGPALSSAPEAGFGTMTATEFHLYESKLSPQGSRYTKLASFALR
jgi:2'-5' RNA ligase